VNATPAGDQQGIEALADQSQAAYGGFAGSGLVFGFQARDVLDFFCVFCRLDVPQNSTRLRERQTREASRA
jgi:hypothetical protein